VSGHPGPTPPAAVDPAAPPCHRRAAAVTGPATEAPQPALLVTSITVLSLVSGTTLARPTVPAAAALSLERACARLNAPPRPAAAQPG